jgi:SM-20-related protein
MRESSILNLETIKKAQLIQEPFPYMMIDNIIEPKFLSEVIKSFPTIKKRGSFPLSALSYKGAFEKLAHELQQPALKNLIGKRFDMDLEDKPPMITVRGYTTERDGHIHVDSESKLITVLLYLNQGWQSSEGCLRLLYNNHDLSRYAAEVSPEAGHCLIFKVTKNCWHGHAPFVGERRSIQLNYVSSQNEAERHLKRHRLSAFLKRLLFKRDDAHSTY